MTQTMNSKEYHNAVKKLRYFFEERGFIEVHTQSRLSILAACEDPRTIATFHYAGNLFPLPQTGQMVLEQELLTNPNEKGFFCISTSFRNEPNPIPGRHDLVFPMAEFEFRGNMVNLLEFEKELLEYLGYGEKEYYPEMSYEVVAKKYDVVDLQAEHETLLWEEYGPVFFLTNFPQYTSPFWNMKIDKVTGTANKIDVILHGIETIGSAERSTDPDQMRELFHTISNGMYADILFAQFSKERVQKELNEFLSFDFFERVGGGIGISRFMRSLKLLGHT